MVIIIQNKNKFSKKKMKMNNKIRFNKKKMK